MSFDGMAMTESAACLMHISDLYPAADLAPAPGTSDRGLWYRWLVYLVNPVQSTFYGFIDPARFARPDGEEAVRTHAVEVIDRYRNSLDNHLASAARTYSESASRAPTSSCSCSPAGAADSSTAGGKRRPRRPLPHNQGTSRNPASLRAGRPRRHDVNQQLPTEDRLRLTISSPSLPTRWSCIDERRPNPFAYGDPDEG